MPSSGAAPLTQFSPLTTDLMGVKTIPCYGNSKITGSLFVGMRGWKYFYCPLGGSLRQVSKEALLPKIV